MVDAKEDGPRLPTLDEMKAQLEQPLDPDLVYFDATPSIQQLAEAFRVMAGRVVALERLLQMQGNINSKLLTSMNHLLFQMQDLQEKPSGLILPDRLNS